MKDIDAYIRESKVNCEVLYNLDPNKAPYLKIELTNEQLQLKKQLFAKVLGIVQHFMQKLIHYMEGIPTLVCVTDAEGYILDLYGDPSIKESVNSLGMTIGVQYTEKNAGTNSVTLALRHEKPIALVGDNHFHHFFTGVACYSAPFYYSDGGRLAGTVSVMTLIDYASQFYLGLLSSAVDTIEREIHLQAQNDKLHLLNDVLMSSTPLGIVMTDKSGNPLEYNTSAEEIIGLKKEDIFENGIKQIHGIEAYMQQVLETGEKIENVELPFSLSENDSPKTLLLDVMPLFGCSASLSMIGVFAQFRDITNYHELQKQVIESEKLSAIGKLGAGLAHEIRNPLTSIMGLTQLLKQNNLQNKYLEIITAELERMKSLVDQFVYLGKPSGISPVDCNLHELITNTVELMNSNAKLNQVDIHFESADDVMYACIDESKIKQVLINFIKNAFEAMPAGGNIWINVEADSESEEVHISITDEGEGMTKEQANNLGTPFFTTKEGGLGMGLPICFDIIKSHNGAVNIDSEKGKGTTIHLNLPISQPAATY